MNPNQFGLPSDLTQLNLAIMGFKFWRTAPKAQLRFAVMVLISPLWARQRNGCANGQRIGMCWLKALMEYHDMRF